MNGKVKSEYVASGIFAQVLAFDDQVARLAAQEAKRQQQIQWQQERDAAEALDWAVAAVCEEATIAFCSVMEAAGYHQHARGDWRKKRQQKKV